MMSKRVKRSVAVAIFNGDRILSTRRSDTDDELPGIWGLPAGSYRENETTEELIARIAQDKLHVKLVPRKKLTEGAQDRPNYRLEMELWEAAVDGEPQHPQWEWVNLDRFQAGAAAGSLCCDLALKAKSRISL